MNKEMEYQQLITVATKLITENQDTLIRSFSQFKDYGVEPTSANSVILSIIEDYYNLKKELKHLLNFNPHMVSYEEISKHINKLREIENRSYLSSNKI